MNLFSKLYPGTLLLLIFLSGCAFTPQQAQLSPNCEISNENLGQGVDVSVSVVDERPEKSLGHRGSAYGKAAEITTSQDLAKLFTEEISKGLQSKGFTPIESSSEFERSLRVEIRLIEYETATGFWTGGIFTKAAMKVFAKSNGKSYQKLYRAENEERVVVVPTAEKNEELLSKIVSDVIEELFSDTELLTLLSQE